MTDRLASLLATSPDLARASNLDPPRLPVADAFAQLLPDHGLRPGSSLEISGVGATSLALALAARASRASWTAVVGIDGLSAVAAAELGVDLDHLVVVADEKPDALAAIVDAFDVVLTGPVPHRVAERLNGRIRERDAVVVAIGRWPGSDVHLEGTRVRWHGIGEGHGHLRARTLDVVCSGRRAGARPRRATVWLPDTDGDVRVATTDTVVPIAR